MKNHIRRGLSVLVLLLTFWSGYAQTDTLCNPNENTKIFGELYFNYGSVVNSYSAFNRSNFTMGQPLVSVQSMLSQSNQSGFGVYSSFLLPPQPPVLLATQGEFKDRIRLSWNVNPLSPAPTGFTIYRDGSYLTDLGENVRQFLDFNVQAGEYYEYSIIAKNIFGSGSEYKSVGFVNPNGVVSGKIETNSNNPVPGVEVRLTPLTGASIAFDGVDDELCISYSDKLPTDKFTVSAYVKLGDGNNETGIIDWGSSLHKNWWITTTNSPTEGKGYIFHIGNGTGSDSLKYFIPNEVTNPELPNQWHQVTMVYNGTALSVMVDGNFVGTKPALISRTKNYLNIGGKIGSTGFFKGNIDDVRIYNRPLTQTEVRATKNRSVSKTENGLVAYWKMDEGVGQKVFDNSLMPTIANIYGGAKFSTDIPEVYNAGVSDVTGYYVIDGINYSTTESFRATPIKNFDFNSALEFNAADMSYGNLTDYDIPDTATVEVLFYPFDLKSRQTILSKGNLLDLYVNNSNLYLNLNGTNTNLGTIKAKYYHVAVAMDNTAGTAKVYLEGELKTTASFTGTSNWANGTPWLVGTNSTTTTGNFYTGLIDEVAIYKKALPQNEIQIHYVTGIPKDSTTANLVSYFDFNEGTDTKVYDYAAVNFGAIGPREGNIINAHWSNNVRRSTNKPHEFQPNNRVVNLNNSNTAVGNIDFKDISTVNVSGYVRFANTFCFEDTIQIYNNGQAVFPPVRTDKKGKWSIDFEPGVSVKLTANYKDHIFGPSFMEFKKLQSPKAGIVFLDNTKRIISGQVAGGKCLKSIIPNGSRVVIKVASTDGCFEITDTLRNPDGKFVFKNLPAKAFTVSVVEHSNSIIYNYFQTKGGLTSNLRDKVADTLNFIYTSPPKVEIAGITANKCGIKTVGQSVPNKIKVKVYEDYYGQKCYLDNFSLHIDDPITGVAGDTTLPVGISEFVYQFIPKNVNIISPYTQSITVSTVVNGSSDVATTDMIILGLKSSGKSFVANTPQLPQFVLRDPPGDGSYAILAKGSTICNSSTSTITNNASQELHNTWSIGGDQIVGIGVAIKTKAKGTLSVAGGSDQTWTSVKTQSTCITTNQTITTSPNDVIVGSMAGGDVYIGTSNAITFGEAILLNYDFDNCSFKKSSEITIDKTELNTDFYYSENYIVNQLIPKLDSIAVNLNVPKIQRDNARIGVNLWKSYILKNRNDIDPKEASTNVAFKSFDAGATFEESIQSDTTNGGTTSFEVAGFVQLAVGAEFETGAIGWDSGASLTYNHSKSNDEDTQTTKSTVITYHLEDNDAGDNFLMKVHKKGKIWGTPIFELIAGETSCPWEKGTKPRSEPSIISDDGTFKTNVPANTAAVFTVELGNLSPTKEQKEYELSLVPESNPDGAIVKANGQIITQHIPYMIPYGQNVKVLVTVEKGPISYNYHDVQIQLESACETSITDVKPTGGGDYAKGLYGGNFGDSLFVRTLNLGVNFIEPCSPVDIGFPLQDWVVTPAAQNKLSITLTEFKKNDPNLKVIRIQYRPIGGDGSWINITSIPKDSLINLYYIYQWQTDLIKDGNYEIRAVAECNDVSKASGISTVIKGSMQRIPPEVVGIPQPSDGTWDPGDEISIVFSKDLNCDKVFQADILANNTIGLYDATTNKLVDATISCLGNKIIIVPKINAKDFENRTFRVMVSGKDYDDTQLALNPNFQAAGIRDKAGNVMYKTVKWEFAVNQNNLEWVGTDVIETNEVLKPFSVKRQIRNRGGSIASFRMENIPSWLTVSPATGTLNPGQVADISMIFQQDLLIGDYLDTLKLIGSNGTEPLVIDFRVRCPAPVYVVDNHAQYEGSMNMVVDLSIFGVTSTDPSDIIVAKIGGQVRGVGKVAYYRNIPADKLRWLTFMTIYGNSNDVGKPIEFHVWQGVKCNEYVEILEEFTYEEGALIGSPLEPAQIHVLNLVKKCIPLNRGFNWVSFNLNLGTGRNTFKNVLSSLKNKDGAYMKTDNNFAEYLGNGVWDALDSLILPTKRYMLYVTSMDTVCFKGEPYKQNLYPITIKSSPQWNWLGYVPSTGMTVTQALKKLTALNGDIIKSQTLFAQYVAGVGWIGNLSFLEPLKGYLLKIGNAGTLTFPSSSNAASLEEINILQNGISKDALAVQMAQEAPMTYDFTRYQLTMNLIGKVNGIEINPDDELRAYVDGKLVGVNKSIIYSKDKLFFQTIYYQDEQIMNFKLFKADKKKEYDLEQNVAFKGESITGLVNEPFIFDLISTTQPPVTIAIENQVISQPAKIFAGVTIPTKVIEGSANCTLFGVSTILPFDTIAKPVCVAQTLDGNMSAVIKMKYNELSSFVATGDMISFTNSVTGVVVGCGVFHGDSNLFYATISGNTTATKVPINVKYYSSTMKKSFMIKAGITYDYNTRLGNLLAPFTIDVSPIAISSDVNGLVTAVMRDTSWTGKYCVNAFAMNCNGYSDGQTTFCFQRLKQGDCVDLIIRKVSETVDSSIKAVSISSEAFINSGVNINYQGGNMIELKPGFDARTGAIFKGQIGGCNNK